MTFLHRLLPSHDIDALLGDIAEERSRRSRFWYWSQLLAIVVVASWRDIRNHPPIALRAIVTGFATLTVCSAWPWPLDTLCACYRTAVTTSAATG